MARTPPKPSVAILADNHKIHDGGKVDCFGIFTNSGLYALPANRPCSIAFGIKHVPQGSLNLSFWIRRPGKKARRLADAIIKSEQAASIAYNAVKINLAFREFGDLEVAFAIGKKLTGQNAFWTPLNTYELDWPKLPTGKKLRKALDDPNSIKSVRANLTCESCGSEYVFQKNLDTSAEFPENSLHFPENGSFRCPECDHVHELKDIEGQVTKQLGKAQSK